MKTPFDIVKDSSIWYNKNSLKTVFQLDSVLYTGVVRSAFNDVETGELRYMVEVHYRSDTIPVSCRMMRRFGGAFNYEDIVYRGYDYSTPAGVAAKTGDHVLVGLLGGQGREGVILGGLTHPSRPNLSTGKGPEFKSEFNGIETYINYHGEYTLTFKAQPVNLAELDKDPEGHAPMPEYDTSIGSSYLKWDRTGSFIVSDNADDGSQRIHIHKPNGHLSLVSGKNVFQMRKEDESTWLTNQLYVLTSPDIRLGEESVTEQAVLGTTFREYQSNLHTDLFSELTGMSIALNLASAQLTVAGADPVFVGLIPGAAAAIATAATAIMDAANRASAMAQSVSSFESNAPRYLSDTVRLK